jgi:hypothetical protein
MTPQELTLQLEEQQTAVTALAALWQSAIGAHCPAHSQWSVWLDLHPFDIVQYGVKETARKFVRMRRQMDADFLIRFASKCMNAERSRQRSKNEVGAA